ncbi:hypothetical protein EUTSA_v10025138mg [Eutrema salsugineum]|uniref:Uncharacterized protein n=1 Tax=Eutrema salsugineum TaxID=72664 RepID=V4MBI6_EUTSA|nr:cilia- and flagella-associated protein 251 [Eutrema salsugineum]XP_006412317.1 cilia- and flagella-associated protein 251 [Eutrema salsugineum]XP_024005283.1 cilia- and flagella-associated protein 251 [Eutrema salsugineum]XP_024005284.1 cilia- and flagella-associated protein 251 [Eutrema salsugineum]ESQ53769.1 hypothetical protein EUTSA_v10025138mg [Eutrema salsugineum]ESQ53770.1 hypothetical protein EUTSA_v10025138mg [Eutrema salsugineum]
MKKPTSRSQRGSKGIKGKHILQICVLLGVCIWLIYQVKYSHDKKKEFYEKDGKKSTVLLSESEDGLVKLGRKDLLPGYHNQNENEKHVEEEEDEEEVSREDEEKESKSKIENGNNEEEKEEEEEVVDEDEEDKNKQVEEVVEEDEEENKHEEDEIDEQDQSKTAGDTDKDDELLEEEKGSGSSESDEKEKETNHADDMTVDEAREEHYKADDASSAVSHESRVLKTEKLKESYGNSTERAQENNSNATISEVQGRTEPVSKLGEAERGDTVEKTTTEVKNGDREPSNSETKSNGPNGNSIEAVLEASGLLENETKIMRERSQEHDKTEDGAPPSGSSDLRTVFALEQARNVSDPNITVSANITNKDSIQDESRSSTSESSQIENISGSNTTEVKENSRFEGDDETGEKESSNLFFTEQTEEADDTSETTLLQEERDALTDPQTLPDVRLEGNEEDEEEAIAAE